MKAGSPRIRCFLSHQKGDCDDRPCHNGKRDDDEEALASGEPLEVESRVRRADGSYRAFLHRKLPLRDEHGNIVKWFGSSIDIEDRKCAEQRIAEKTNKLERSEFYLREGERLARMGSWSLRPDGVFDYWSPETFAIFGFDPAKGIPTLKEWLDVLHQSDGDRVNALIRKMFSDGVMGLVHIDPPRFGEAQMGRGTAGRSPVVEGSCAAQSPSVSASGCHLPICACGENGEDRL